MTDKPAVRNRSRDFYQRLRAKVDSWTRRHEIDPAWSKYLLAVPDLLHLVTKLVIDRRVSLVDKAILGVAVAYVLSPIDLLPELLGPVGVLDDLVVLVVALDIVLARVPRPLIEQHWAGDGDLIALIRDVLDAVGARVKGLPGRVRELLVSASRSGKRLGREVTAAAARGAKTVRRSAREVAARVTAGRKPARRRKTSARAGAAAPKRSKAVRTSRAAGPARKTASGTRAPAAGRKKSARRTTRRRTASRKGPS